MKPCTTFALWFALVTCLNWTFGSRAADLVHAKDGSGVYGYKDTPKLPWCPWLVHDPDRLNPRRVNPGEAGPPSPIAKMDAASSQTLGRSRAEGVVGRSVRSPS